MLLDIVILPPASLRQRIGKKVSQVVRKYPHKFVVDNRKLIPHMSLFHLRILKAHLPRITTIVKKIAQEHKPQKIYSTAFAATDTFIGFRLSNNMALRELNRAIVQACYKLRTGEMPWTPKNQPLDWELRNRKKYGTQHNIGKSFQPHLTMGWMKKPEDAKAVADAVGDYNFEFRGSTIAICEVNFWHQVTRIIKRFEIR